MGGLQLAAGILYMHSKNIAHRDIKLENALFFSTTNVKLVDLGFAGEMRLGNPMLTMICGSLLYVRATSPAHWDYLVCVDECSLTPCRWPRSCSKANRTVAGVFRCRHHFP